MRSRRENVVYVNNAGKPSRFLVDLASGGTQSGAMVQAIGEERSEAAVFLYKKFESAKTPKVDLLDPAGHDSRSLAERLLVWQIVTLLWRPVAKGSASLMSGLVVIHTARTKRRELPETGDYGPAAGPAWNWRGSLRPALVFLSLLAVLALPFKGIAIYQDAQDLKGNVLGALESAVTIGRVVGEAGELKLLADHFLGHDRDRRWLLVFQNNTELRASGGFIGSYAIVDFSQGRIKNLEVPGGGSYDTTAGLRDFIKAPEPLSLVSPRWFFWDANWWPDWPASADKLEWFLERSDGPTVDGVISLTPTVIERLLDRIGPVELPERGLTIDSANFWPEIQTLVEIGPPEPGPAASSSPATSNASTSPVTATARHEPKKVIGELMAAILGELPARLERENALGLAVDIFRLLDEEHILLHFNDERAQTVAGRFGWDGAQKTAGKDYLLVVHSNIAGGKTDKVVGERLKLATTVEEDGSLVNRLTIERPHSGEPRVPLTGVRNVDWLRVYVPQGSELLAASGFLAPDSHWFEPADPEWADDPDVAASEGQASVRPDGTKIYDENGKTVFANWLMVDPGMTGKIVLDYKLPFKYEAEHSLTVEKQPGSLGSEFAVEIVLPDGSVWQAQDKLTTDKFYNIQYPISNIQ